MNGDLGAGGDVEAGLDDAVIAEGDADAGVRAEQAALADGDDFLAATGQRAHDGGAAAHVGAVTHDDASGNATLDHGGAQRAGVEVDEALVHDGGALSEVGAQAHAVRVADAHAGWHDVVDHAREFVDGEDDHRATGGEAAADHLEVGDGAGTVIGPHDVGEQAEDAIHVEAVWLDRAVRKQVEAQVRVVGVHRSLVQVLDGRLHGDAGDATLLIRADEGSELLRGLLQAGGAGRVHRLIRIHSREPNVEDGAVVGERGQSAGGC